MELRVEYTGQLRWAIGRSEDRIELPEGATVSELVMYLAERCGEQVRFHLLNHSGHMQLSLLVAINGNGIGTGQAASIVLQHNDTVVLLPPIGGG